MILTKETQIDSDLRKQMYDKAWLQGQRNGKSKVVAIVKAKVNDLDLSDEHKNAILSCLPKVSNSSKERLAKKKAKLEEQLAKVIEQEEAIAEENDEEADEKMRNIERAEEAEENAI